MKKIAAKLIRIGNSQGVRLSKPVLEESQLEGDVEIEVRKRAVIIRPARGPRAGWGERFEKMHAAGDDVLAFNARSSWDDSEWEW